MSDSTVNSSSGQESSPSSPALASGPPAAVANGQDIAQRSFGSQDLSMSNIQNKMLTNMKTNVEQVWRSIPYLFMSLHNVAVLKCCDHLLLVCN